MVHRKHGPSRIRSPANVLKAQLLALKMVSPVWHTWQSYAEEEVRHL